MYLQESAITPASLSITTNALLYSSTQLLASDVSATNVEPQFNWILYTVVGASVLLALIFLVIIYDLFQRCYEFREQQILDGSQPISPGHQPYSYTFAIRVEEASSVYDTKLTVIKMDLLDSQNQYLTTVAIPSFVFRFKQVVGKSVESLPGYPLNSVFATRNNMSLKSYDVIKQTWSNTPRASIVVFHLIRRNPLKDFAAIRITHDCYKPNGFITLQYVIIRDDATKQSARVDLQGTRIYAAHPCPAGSYQVFPASKVVGNQQLDESRSCWMPLIKRLWYS